MSITGSIFLRTDTGLVELRESAYDSEAILQQLLADYPSLVPGDQIDASSPRRLLLIRREMDVPGEEDGAGRWSLDHLFVDQDGVPTLVEVKRSTDTRIRREVVGQLLDYAANAVAYWPIARLRAAFEATCSAASRNPEASLRDFLGDEEAFDRFWPTVQTNLQAGRIRLVFVADVIPQELRRVVEFLNQQMNPAEVLALEVKQYVGQNLQTLVPRIIGQTATAQQRKATGTSSRRWDERLFFETLATTQGDSVTRVARQLLDWARPQNLRIWWGKGKNVGSFYLMLDLHGTNYYTFAVMTNGKVLMPFYGARGRPAMEGSTYLRGFADRLGAVVGVDFTDDDLSGGPQFPLELLTDPQTLADFKTTLDEYLGHIKGYRIEPEG